jgi:hypothetical protein
VICQFIDVHKDAFGVAPICRALSAHGVLIAPRTYWARRSRPPSRRALWDMTVTEVLAGIYEPDERGRRTPESVYGSLKMWAYLRRLGMLTVEGNSVRAAGDPPGRGPAPPAGPAAGCHGDPSLRRRQPGEQPKDCSQDQQEPVDTHG